MASLGHPILGDFFYGGEQEHHCGDLALGEERNNQLSESCASVRCDNDKIVTCSAADRAGRLLLHAEEMTLRQPQNGDKITFTAPCPFTIDTYG